MTQYFPAFVAGWLICAALLALFHLLWRHTHRTVRYLLGAGAICTGCSVAGAVLDDAVLAFGPWVITSAGLLIAVWTWAEERAEAKARSAQKSGEIIGAARGLTQDLIDTGGGHGSDRPRSQN